MELPILYEDENVVAIAKPAGMLTHADNKSDMMTAEEWFKMKYPKGAGYVHRLDRDTSGVLLFAKNASAYEFLRKAFRDREIQKTYVAFVYGVPKEKRGVIDFDIGRSRKNFRLRSAQPKAKGRLREARTLYEVLGEAEECAMLKVNPETGRTHQIRVHLKAIHHPVVGDALYAPNHPAALGISRLGLHAYALDIPLPGGTHAIITAPIPKDLIPAYERFPDTTEKFAVLRDAC
ncbi:MAG: RNA pseudouridine synthase [Patescibacteria group bacterium]|nr:RNA pseudouridine synthase [Patescibacteria group bacterium]